MATSRGAGDPEAYDIAGDEVLSFMAGEELAEDTLGPDWIAFDPSLRPTAERRGHGSKPTTARVGERLNTATGKWEATVDEEGYEWIVPAETSFRQRPFAHAVGYSRQEKKLRVVFREGSQVSHFRGTWAYENVTGTDWYNLRRHRSTGRYVQKNLKSHNNHFEEFQEPW